MQTHFSDRDLYFIAAGFLCAAFSAFFFVRGKTKTALLVLLLSAFSFRLLMALIDPFVHIWDEQFHALVAANMSRDFFHPQLYRETLLWHDPSNWTVASTWLHKPPLFLWQMALSIKIFGSSPLAIRLPSVLLSTLMVPAVYRIGKIAAGERTGYIAALLLACSCMHINVVSGFLNTDQNDVVFAAYVLFSTWTWTEYVHDGKLRWILLTGVFAAAAVLVKWLPGLLVFGGWGAAILLQSNWRRSWMRWRHLLLAGITCIFTAAPWFIYAYARWPAEWKMALTGYGNHLGDALGHPGPWWYHFGELREQFGWLIVALLIPGLCFFLLKKSAAAIRIAFPMMILAVYGFYSFVPTRMPLFCFIVTPLLLVMAAFTLDELLLLADNRMKRFSAALGLLLFFTMSWLTVDLGRLEHFHTERDPKAFYRKTRMYNRAVFERAARKLPPQTVVFNCGGFNYVPCMFYTGLTAYGGLPTPGDIEKLKTLHRPVAVFDDNHLPAYLLSDSSLVILRDSLVRNGF